MNLFVLFGRPPSTMDAVWPLFMTADEQLVKNTSSSTIKLITQLF
jgi:hypothetical protein